MRIALQLWLMVITCASTCPLSIGTCHAQPGTEPEGISTREARMQAIRGIPLDRLNRNISGEVREVLENPSYFRRMPPQVISCDQRMFTFLVRRPEVMVNIWEVMGITKVKAKRTSPLSFLADDGVGTSCKCDLIYSDDKLHIYWGNGAYEGSMAPRKIHGRCLCLLRTDNQVMTADGTAISGTMDVFLKVDNFGADLLTRTIGPFVGKTADYNFVETAKFISQISSICQTNPAAAQALVQRLDRVDDNTRREFGEIVTQIASNRADQDTRQAFTGFKTTSKPALELPPQTASTALSADSISPTQAATKPSQPQFWERRVEPASPSLALDASEQASTQAFAPVLPAPTVIMPRKANIFMRR